MTDAHLDDLALSEHLDDPQPVTGQHVATCAHCRDRLAELRRAADTVAAPVAPPSAAARDEAVRAALVAADAGADAPAVAGEASARIPRRWVPVALAAAALAALLAVVPVVLDDDDAADETAAQGAGQDEAFRSSSVAHGGDLGAIDDAQTLARALGAELPGQAGDAGGREPVTAAPQMAQTAESGGDGAGTGDAGPACVAAAEALGGPALGELQYVATLRWQGTPAEALVFAAGDDAALSRRVFVLSQDGCRLLVAQSF